MAIQIDRLTNEDSGRKVRIFFADGDREAQLHSWNLEANLLIVSHDANGLAFYSPALADFA